MPASWVGPVAAGRMALAAGDSTAAEVDAVSGLEHAVATTRSVNTVVRQGLRMVLAFVDAAG
ncbi:hypothetical protein TUM20985_33940 [Mycobacterium antarcticum]|uniref:hypothetical protein n=1 Tax=Mycolicibacterium sp. TUM20984 TaxID=3023368 RepID=UPI0023870C6B|nr:hypothetical protein [Mycolicibacterium sp. TUM20984]BDX32847.1 hypothetical protein TUM20985_33940 [Mycolicibacterium sp. TUM20985]GLP83612.1 hypothetical protein TUM20984_50320 [Mycolicibacterium sp. TUM20984]